MSKKEHIKKNVQVLSNIDLKTILFNITLREVGDEMVGFVTLLVDPKTGEIRDLSAKRLWSEDAVTAEALLKKKDLLDSKENILLELLSKDIELAPNAYSILEESLEAFNHRTK